MKAYNLYLWCLYVYLWTWLVKLVGSACLYFGWVILEKYFISPHSYGVRRSCIYSYKGIRIILPSIYPTHQFVLGNFFKNSFKYRGIQMGHTCIFVVSSWKKYFISPHSYGIRGSSIHRRNVIRIIFPTIYHMLPFELVN